MKLTAEQLARLKALQSAKVAGLELSVKDAKELSDLEALKAKSGDIEVTDEALDAITAKSVEAVKAANEEFMKKLEKIEGVLDKKIKDASDEGADFGVTKFLYFTRAAIDLVSMKAEKKSLVEWNTKALELRAKAGYNNETVDADGGYLIMDPEFEVAIEKIALNYGIAFSEATIRPTDRNAIKSNKRGSNVVMAEVAEGGIKAASKLGIEQVLVELREFAGYAISSDLLIEDAALDFWMDVQDGFAEEMARIADIMVFTDRTANKEGILHIAGTKAVTIGANPTDAIWDNLLDAEVMVSTRTMQLGSWYMHKSFWNVIRKCKGTDGHYLWLPSMGMQTPWGTRIVLVDAMPAITDIGDANEGYAVFGDLKRVRLYRKRGIEFLESRHATVTDADGVSINLFKQDMTALRATVRMVVMHKFPEEFVVVGTGTVS